MSKQTRHEVSNKDIRMLAGAILDYLCRIKSDKGNKDSRRVLRHKEILTDFLVYAISEEIAWEDMFTFDTFIKFRKRTGVKKAASALVGISGYLHDNGHIAAPLQIPNYQIQLPDIYEQYLCYLGQVRAFSKGTINGTRRVLASLNDGATVDHIQIVTSLIESRWIGLAEIFAMLDKILRQHSIDTVVKLPYGAQCHQKNPP